MDCKHATHLISQSQEIRLPWRKRVRLHFHLMLCRACTRFVRQLALLRRAVRLAGRQIENDQRLKLSNDARRRIAAVLETRKHSLADARQNPDQNFTD